MPLACGHYKSRSCFISTIASEVGSFHTCLCCCPGSWLSPFTFSIARRVAAMQLSHKDSEAPLCISDPTLSTPASCGPTWSHVCRPLAFMKPGLIPPLRDISAAPACMGPSDVQTCSSRGPRYQPLHLSRIPFLNSHLYSYLLLEEIVPTLSGSAYCWQCLQPLGLVSLTHSLVPGTQVKGNRGKKQREQVNGHIFKCT